MPFCFIFTWILSSLAIYSSPLPQKLKIQAYFSKCPKKPSNDFVFATSKKFENENYSLIKLRKYILEQHLPKKYFLESYQIKFDPLRKKLTYLLNCSEPALQVNILGKKNTVLYKTLLTESGHIQDPNYLLFQNDRYMPELSIRKELLTPQIKRDMIDIVKKFKNKSNSELSEILYSDNGYITLIIRTQKNITSVFLGTGFWEDKIKRIHKIMSHLNTKKKLPTQINITNIDKVVIKF